MTFDFQGLASLIASVTGSIVALVVLRRQGRIEKQVNSTHDLVNGQSLKLDTAIKEAAFAAGEKAGTEGERVRSEHP